MRALFKPARLKNAPFRRSADKEPRESKGGEILEINARSQYGLQGWSGGNELSSTQGESCSAQEGGAGERCRIALGESELRVQRTRLLGGEKWGRKFGLIAASFLSLLFPPVSGEKR